MVASWRLNSWRNRLVIKSGWVLAVFRSTHFFVRTAPPNFLTYGAMVSNERVYFDVTMRLGLQARSNFATALAWVYPESARGRSTSSLVQDSAGIALAWRNTINGTVARWCAANASDKTFRGFLSNFFVSSCCASSTVTHRVSSTSWASGSGR